MEAQSTTLNAVTASGPPLLMERLVLRLIPPAARETVGGDLCEMYRSPLQYGWQAATALPFVVMSQARRNANWPVLGLQGLVLFACFNGIFALANVTQGYAALAAIAGLFILLIQEAYQTRERPTCRRAILETIILSGVVLLLFPQQLLMPTAAHTVVIWWPGFVLLAFLMALIPVLCCLRAGLILEVDRRYPPQAQDGMTADDVPQDYHRFRQRMAWNNRLEGAALLLMAVAYAILIPKFGAAEIMGPSMVTGACASAALYLLMDGAAGALPPANDFLSLRTLYQYELARRHQLRRFLWWLWSAPLFLALYENLILRGVASHQPPQVTLGILAALLLGFFIDALNREGAGPIQEKITALGRMELEIAK